MFELIKTYAINFLNNHGDYIYYDINADELVAMENKVSHYNNLVYLGQL